MADLGKYAAAKSSDASRPTAPNPLVLRVSAACKWKPEMLARPQRPTSTIRLEAIASVQENQFPSFSSLLRGKGPASSGSLLQPHREPYNLTLVPSLNFEIVWVDESSNAFQYVNNY